MTALNIIHSTLSLIFLEAPDVSFQLSVEPGHWNASSLTSNFFAYSPQFSQDRGHLCTPPCGDIWPPVPEWTYGLLSYCDKLHNNTIWTMFINRIATSFCPYLTNTTVAYRGLGQFNHQPFRYCTGVYQYYSVRKPTFIFGICFKLSYILNQS